MAAEDSNEVAGKVVQLRLHEDDANTFSDRHLSARRRLRSPQACEASTWKLGTSRNKLPAVPSWARVGSDPPKYPAKDLRPRGEMVSHWRPRACANEQGQFCNGGTHRWSGCEMVQ